MIFGKTNLQAVDITRIDKAIPVLNNVHFTADGSTVATNGKSIIAVSPIAADYKKNVPLKEVRLGKDITVNADTVKEVLKNIPKDSLFRGLLEHCEVTADESGVQFELTDGKRTKKINGRIFPRAYVPYRQVFGNAKKSTTEVKVVLDRKRFMSLLDAMDRVCPDSSGQAPVFIEFTSNNDVLLRCVNRVNGQRAIAVMSSFKGAEGQWLEEDVWERKMCGKGAATLKEAK